MSIVADRRSVLTAWLLPIAMAVVGGAAVAFLFMNGGDDDDGDSLGMLEDGRPDVGSPAPDFELAAVEDEEAVRRLSDYEGKVVVLNWYATWCAPCREEIPTFQEAQDALANDVVFLLVNLEQSREEAQGMLDDLGATMPAVLDADGSVGERYRVTGMPTTYYIDRDGTVVAGGPGKVTEEALRDQLGDMGLEY